MESYRIFEEKLEQALACIGEEVLQYDESEFWMIRSDYEFVEYYAAKNRLFNTAIALPLARGLHNGVHRKSSLIRNDVSYKLPYVIHPLQVCRFLIELHVPMSNEERDLLFAAALCHDMIEDVPFEDGGREMYTKFGLDPRVYETVKVVSKRKDFTVEEELAHFQAIAENPLGLLIKLSDRGNNVEDLYNRTSWKVHEYVGETRKFFLPMMDYAFAHYPELASSLAILKDKIVSLTDAAEFLVNKYDQQEDILKKRVEELRRENEALRKIWRELWQKSLMEDGKPDSSETLDAAKEVDG